jgi:hypothetical protein
MVHGSFPPDLVPSWARRRRTELVPPSTRSSRYRISFPHSYLSLYRVLA